MEILEIVRRLQEGKFKEDSLAKTRGNFLVHIENVEKRKMTTLELLDSDPLTEKKQDWGYLQKVTYGFIGDTNTLMIGVEDDSEINSSVPDAKIKRIIRMLSKNGK